MWVAPQSSTGATRIFAPFTALSLGLSFNKGIDGAKEVLIHGDTGDILGCSLKSSYPSLSLRPQMNQSPHQFCCCGRWGVSHLIVSSLAEAAARGGDLPRALALELSCAAESPKQEGSPSCLLCLWLRDASPFSPVGVAGNRLYTVVFPGGLGTS